MAREIVTNEEKNIRLAMAALFMASRIIATPGASTEQYAKIAVQCADALLAELAK